MILTTIPQVQKLLLTNVIAPHGITDIIHAYHYKSFHHLAYCYGTNIAITTVLGHYKYNTIIYALLCIGSFFHFRHDFRFPIASISICLPLTNICTFGTLCSIIRDPDPMFYIYMCLLHVPHHFEMASSYIHPYKWWTIGLLCMVSACTQCIWKTKQPQKWFPLGVGIILGHIWYGEKYILKSL